MDATPYFILLDAAPAETMSLADIVGAVQYGLSWFFGNLSPAFLWAVLGIVVCSATFAYYWHCLKPRPHSLEWIEMAEAASQPRHLSFVLPYHPLTSQDALPVILLTAVYAMTAFFQLGNLDSPQTWQSYYDSHTVTWEMSETVQVSGVGWFHGLGTGTYSLEASADGEHWKVFQYTDQVWEDGAWRDKDYGEDTTGKSTRTAYYWRDVAEGSAPGSVISIRQSYNTLFKWYHENEGSGAVVEARYFRLTGVPETAHLPMELGELVLYDAWGNRIETQPVGGNVLFDEQDTVPEHSTYMDSSYFDEIYHPRTAYENLRNVYPYETSHPPLGKLIISLGVLMFGMTPFGWRFMGTLFGVLMVPLLYVFLKNLFGKSSVALCGTALFAFDFMHLVQTRIATIDTYGVFFILCSYYFMYRWLAVQPGKRLWRYLVPLVISGILWGIGCASKWTVVYAGLGLALMWLIGIISRGVEWHVMAHPVWRGEGEPPKPPKLPKYPLHVLGTILTSIVCYVLIPVCIYTASYFPYAWAKGNQGSFWDLAVQSVTWPAEKLPGYLETAGSLIQEEDSLGDRAGRFFNAIPNSDDPVEIMLKNQYFMFTYHQGVHDDHPYQSNWYQWIFDGRPILYYRDLDYQSVNGTKSLFASFNNPLVSWLGLAAFFAVLIQTFRRKSGTCLFILIAILSQFLPWLPIGRTLFAYHYFPTILFLVFAISYLFNDMMDRRRKGYRLAVYGFTGCAAVLYAVFYPALIGLYIPSWYAELFLRWFPSWPL